MKTENAHREADEAGGLGRYGSINSKDEISETELMVLLNGGLVRLKMFEAGSLIATSRQVAEFLEISIQRVNQLCLDQGLPKLSRDKFYLPSVMNWKKVQQVAQLLEKYPKELEYLGLVDFTLGASSVPEIDVSKLFPLAPAIENKQKNKTQSKQKKRSSK
jgi:hypothetical protein